MADFDHLNFQNIGSLSGLSNPVELVFPSYFVKRNESNRFRAGHKGRWVARPPEGTVRFSIQNDCWQPSLVVDRPLFWQPAWAFVSHEYWRRTGTRHHRSKLSNLLRLARGKVAISLFACFLFAVQQKVYKRSKKAKNVNKHATCGRSDVLLFRFCCAFMTTTPGFRMAW